MARVLLKNRFRLAISVPGKCDYIINATIIRHSPFKRYFYSKADVNIYFFISGMMSVEQREIKNNDQLMTK